MAFLALVTLYANTRQPGQGTRNRLVGKAPCRVGCDSIHDIIGLALYFEGRLHTLPNRRSVDNDTGVRSEEHTSELQSLMRISYAVLCLKKKKQDRSLDHKTS